MNIRATAILQIITHVSMVCTAQIPCENFHPQYSPDNKRIIFDGKRDTTHAIFIVDLSTAKEELIFNGPARDAHPGWFPDGSSVVFQSQRNENWFMVDVWKKNLNEKPVRLTAMPGFAGVPTVSPDGKRILFQFKPTVSEADYEKNYWHIWVMNSDGSKPHQLTFGSFNCQVPTFSPDGTNIIFYSDKTGNEEIYRMDAEGSNHRQLTNHPEADNAPSMSRDGKLIAFKSTREGPREIYVMEADGSNVRRMTFDQDSHGGPTWSADSKKILFHSSASGAGRILVLDVETRKISQPVGCPAK